MQPLVVVGAGGHGRELWSVAHDVNDVAPTWDMLGFVDDGPVDDHRVERVGGRVLGPVEWLIDRDVRYALGVGASATRRAIVDRLAKGSARPATIVAPGASVGLDVELGDGVVVYDRSTLTTDVRIGRHTHVNVGCAVQHDSVVGEFVQMSPGVLINGDCVIGDDVFLGSGAVVTRGCRVGAAARIGAGAVVLDDVPPGALAVGVPARIVPEFGPGPGDRVGA